MTSDPYAFSFEPLFLALAVVAGAVYWRAARRERPPWWRVALFAAGLVLVAGALNSPLQTIATQRLLLVHLLQNVIVADWAPPLLILGLTPAMRAALAQRGGRAFAALTRPRVALPVWLGGWYLVHLAVFYDAALRNAVLLNLEHAVLLTIGLVFWWPVISDVPHAPSSPVRIAYLGTAFIVSAFLGLAYTFSNTPFYGFYEETPELWGLSPIEDQNLGGVMMTGEQAIVFLAAISVFVLRLLKEEEAKERELDDRLRRAGLRPGEEPGPRSTRSP